MTAPCAARALEGLNLMSNLYFENMFFTKFGKNRQNTVESCQKSQKLTEISQKMTEVHDFTAKIDFVERPKVKFFRFWGLGELAHTPSRVSARLKPISPCRQIVARPLVLLAGPKSRTDINWTDVLKMDFPPEYSTDFRKFSAMLEPARWG